MEYLEYAVQDYVGVLTINRPKAMNALNKGVLAELAGLLGEISSSDVRCLIITGAGEKAFVAGADISEMKDLSAAEAKQLSEDGSAVMEQIEGLPMPTLAAVNGFALGGGCELALSCDILIAADNASFSLPEVGLGVMPGFGGVQRMVRAVGLSKAKELVFTTSRVKAEEAVQLGLANKMVPAADLLKVSQEMAQRIAANAPFGVRAAKKVANDSIGLTLDKSTRLDCDLFGQCFSTADQKEGMAAFLEKRKPAPFTGK